MNDASPEIFIGRFRNGSGVPGIETSPFLCSQNKLRSPTAERIFSNWSELIVASAGFNHDAEVKINADYVAGSDLIFVMEKRHEEQLKRRFSSHLAGVEVICLNIPDQYDYMDPELVKILLEKVPGYLK